MAVDLVVHVEDWLGGRGSSPSNVGFDGDSQTIQPVMMQLRRTPAARICPGPMRSLMGLGRRLLGVDADVLVAHSHSYSTAEQALEAGHM